MDAVCLQCVFLMGRDTEPSNAFIHSQLEIGAPAPAPAPGPGPGPRPRPRPRSWRRHDGQEAQHVGAHRRRVLGHAPVARIRQLDHAAHVRAQPLQTLYDCGHATRRPQDARFVLREEAHEMADPRRRGHAARRLQVPLDVAVVVHAAAKPAGSYSIPNAASSPEARGLQEPTEPAPGGVAPVGERELGPMEQGCSARQDEEARPVKNIMRNSRAGS